MTPVLTVEDLSFRYEDGTKALDGVNFSLGESETVAILGANGSGKTTFVLHLNGILSGTGRIALEGVELSTRTVAEFRRKIGIVFQDSDHQLFMPTVLDDVAFGPLNYGASKREAERLAREALELMDIGPLAGKAPHHLSAGEKKRAAIAGTLAMQPRVLVFDEPTTFLDPPGRERLRELLQRLPQPKLLVTHETGFARRIATRAVFFERGSIVADGDVLSVAAQRGWLDGPYAELETKGGRGSG